MGGGRLSWGGKTRRRLNDECAFNVRSRNILDVVIFCNDCRRPREKVPSSHTLHHAPVIHLYFVVLNDAS